jgi:hypothetical protein
MVDRRIIWTRFSDKKNSFQLGLLTDSAKDQWAAQEDQQMLKLHAFAEIE